MKFLAPCQSFGSIRGVGDSEVVSAIVVVLNSLVANSLFSIFK